MRVATNSFTNSLVDQLNRLSARQTRLQTEAATGQRLIAPEDDPAAMRRVLDLQAEGTSIAQFQKNISFLTEKAGASYEVMRGLKKISDRVGEIATLADDMKSPDELKIYATEVTQLIRQAVQFVNGKHRGDYLLGGTQVDQPPFAATFDADGNAVAVTYQGNTDVPDVEVAEGSFVAAQTPGANSTGSGARGLVADSRFGADLFAHLISLQNHLLAGDTAGIASTDRPALGKDEENLIFQMGTNGALQSRLEAADSLASSRALSVDGLVSKEADADLAETMVRLNQTQTAYTAALQSGATIMQTSLLDFLH
jgi:flagellar hook-associated protein 3 FlgL